MSFRVKRCRSEVVTGTAETLHLVSTSLQRPVAAARTLRHSGVCEPADTAAFGANRKADAWSVDTESHGRTHRSLDVREERIASLDNAERNSHQCI